MTVCDNQNRLWEKQWGMKQKIQKELNDALKYNLSFAGCGFLGIYHGEKLNSWSIRDVLYLINWFNFTPLKSVLLWPSKSSRPNCSCRRFPELLVSWNWNFYWTCSHYISFLSHSWSIGRYMSPDRYASRWVLNFEHLWAIFKCVIISPN